jgi:hypothetical protein
MVVGLVPEPDLGVRDDPEYFAASRYWCSGALERRRTQMK